MEEVRQREFRVPISCKKSVWRIFESFFFALVFLNASSLVFDFCYFLSICPSLGNFNSLDRSPNKFSIFLQFFHFFLEINYYFQTRYFKLFPIFCIYEK